MENWWKKIQDVLQQEIGIGAFTLWFAPIEVTLEGTSLTLYPPTEYAASKIRSKYDIVLQAVCYRVLGFSPVISMEVRQKKNDKSSMQQGSLLKFTPPANKATERKTLPLPEESIKNIVDDVLHDAIQEKIVESDKLHYMEFTLEQCANTSANTATRRTIPMVSMPKQRKKTSTIIVTDSLQGIESTLPSTFGMSIPQATNTSTASTITVEEESKRVAVGQEYLALQYQGKNPSFNYSFDSFLVGTCNMLAHASSRALCESTKHSLAHSLYLSSTPGLGKTHLMQALGHELIKVSNIRNVHIEYLSAEDLTTQFTMAMHQKTLPNFLNRLKSADVLLLEDVHFLQSKERMQAQLLNVIKALQNRGSKIVFSSSFSLKEIKDIDDQLASCFQDGYVAHITAPDIEFRKEIIRRKASMHHISLPEPVTHTIAENICTDIRKLESCLKTIILKARTLNEEINLALVLEVLSSYSTNGKKITFEDIIDVVCKAFAISKERLTSNSRQKECVFARHIIFYLARSHTDMTLKELGYNFNKKHSTVIKGITNIEQELVKDTPKARQILSLFSLFDTTYPAHA